VIQGFKGEILQLPPMYSALKHKGVPLYKLARKGESVPRPERKVIIYDIEVLEVDIPYVTFRLVCSGGTYVRTICHDAGQKLFCGAHMTSLKRIRSGPFHINQALEVEDIEGFSCKRAVEEYLVSPKDALIRLAEVIVSEELVDKVKNGVQITAEDIFEMELPDFKAGQKIKIISPEGFLVGVVESLKDKEALFSEGNPEDKVFKSLRVFSVGN
jgi:tRNA pseudouridine55 synthase